MKFLVALLFTTLAASAVLALPAGNPKDEVDVDVDVPTKDFRDFKGVIDTGSRFPFLQSTPTGFGLRTSFINSFEDIFRRLHASLWPVVGDDSSTDTDSSGDGSGLRIGSGSDFGFALRPVLPLNPKNANTTSTVKVVDGHKIEVNETVYGDQNSVFKVRVVNIRPVDSDEEVTTGVINTQGQQQPDNAPTTSAPGKHSELDDFEEDERREPLEKQPADNEVRDIDGTQYTQATTTRTTRTTASKFTTNTPIPIGEEDSVAQSANTTSSYQLLAHSDTEESSTPSDIMADIMDSVQLQMASHLPLLEEDAAAGSVEDAQTIAQNEEAEALHESHIEATGNKSFDDSDDEYDDDEPATKPPQSKDREELESSDDEDASGGNIEMSSTFNDEWGTLEDDLPKANNAENDLNNDIDLYEPFTPVDLSNDIAVNDIAAQDPTFPYNPDAELIDVAIGSSGTQMLPKFEKLSLSQTPLMK